MRAPLFVELCAGLASVSLMLQGGKYARPPVSRMGNKHGYGLAILRVMGLRPGQGAERYLWCEPDPGCRALLHAYTDREVMKEAARIIRSWKDEEPRALWERLRAEGPIRVGEAREVARFARIVSGNRLIPMHHDGDKWCNSARNTKAEGTSGGLAWGGEDFATGTVELARGMVAPTLPATVTPDARAVDPREVARWAQVQSANELIHISGHTLRNTGKGGSTCADPSHGFHTTAAKLAKRLHERSQTLPATITPDARPIEPADLMPGTVVYMDPPYRNTTGYGNDLPRSEVVSMARRWADAGARVYISEAEPIGALVDDGWFTVEITSQRIGHKRTFSKQQREWVTCSHEPAWRPAEQVGLFG